MANFSTFSKDAGGKLKQQQQLRTAARAGAARPGGLASLKAPRTFKKGGMVKGEQRRDYCK